MKGPRLTRILALLLSLLPLVASGADAPSLLGRVVEKRLTNGMTVLALKRPGAPVVSLQMTYRVGAVDEPSATTGMAHLLEHMMFKGTRTLGTRDWKAEEPLLAGIEKTGREVDRLAREGKPAPRELTDTLARLQEEAGKLTVRGEIDGIYSRNGAVGLNASTGADITSYFVSLPSNRLELWASLESQRMREPVLREYYTERKVVAEERRERKETNPRGMLYEALLATAFTAHPYRNPVIGWASDLDTLDITDTRAFYEAHYGPDNAVVAAVGDLDPEAFVSLVERYFGDLPPRGGQQRTPTREPVQEGPKSVTVYFDAQPTAALAYHKPTQPHRDDYVLDVIDALLTDGASSRLVKELVYRKQLLTSVHSSNGSPGARYDNLFLIIVSPAKGIKPEAALEAVRAELKRLADQPPQKEELARVMAGLKADMVRSLISDAGLAGRLAYFQAVAGDWRYVEKLPEVLATVTPEEVSAVAAKYFKVANETSAFLLAPVEAK